MGFAILLPLSVICLFAQAPPRFAIEVNRIQVPVHVSQKEKAILGLQASDFILLDQGSPQSILQFANEEQPLDIMLLLDQSGSMANMIESLKLKAAEALTHLRPRDRVGLMGFSGEPFLLLAPTFSHPVVASEAQQIYVRGMGTNLYDSILHTAQYLKRVGRPNVSQVILILTDNDGNRHKNNMKQVTHALWELDISLYGIFYHRGHQSFLSDCRPIINATGGDVVWADNKKLPLAEMFRKMRERYVLTYSPPATESAATDSASSQPGTRRSIQVRIRQSATQPERKSWRVRSRTGYLVPSPSPTPPPAMRN